VNLPQSSIIDKIADHRDELLNENRKLNQRIKRLEEAGDRAIENSYYPDRVKVWTEAKEAKP
jgi:cell division septum initiation protein DivIVA